jgi:hypothetical protein
MRPGHDPTIIENVSARENGMTWRPPRFSSLVRPEGLEPPHLAPEASALSTELRARRLRVYRTSLAAGEHSRRQIDVGVWTSPLPAPGPLLKQASDVADSLRGRDVCQDGQRDQHGDQDRRG